MDLTPLERAGRLVQVVGESGSGLSLLARTLHERVPRVAVLRQDAAAHVSFLRETVVEEVCVGLEQRGVGRAEMQRRARALLEVTGLANLSERNPATLSGGQTRRLAFACVAVLDPDTLVLDDPFAGLDADSTSRIAAYLCSIPARVILLGHEYVEEVGGTRLSLLDATLTTSTPPCVPLQLPQPVSASGAAIDLGEVGATRGGGTRRWWKPRPQPSFVLEPVRVVARPGRVLWLRGGNGSGKTSLLRALAGLDGAPAPRVPTSLALQRSADQVAEATVGSFVGSERLAQARGWDPEEHPLDLSARNLRLAQLAQVFAQDRPLVLLDEPDVGLDTTGRSAAHAEIAAGLRRGAAVVITCHDAEFVAQVRRYAQVEELVVSGAG
ncbi:ATP-binding cassette domain-containing protein [Corynebacterium timonense]|uniref:Energy-coupling factor transport system ATP-binding protein n=1 Tax=Corynebacterium timonense TaxID=441500 RepID=A0A1H1QAL7_9CORY|nr:ATP-binding cassette domain-containing protein [Corynebacterium timonense]SDS20561.1 energy-coupling factor transport system ATP-binding protein [Corynebacterium timonense]